MPTQKYTRTSAEVRDLVTHFVTHNNKTDLQTHSRSLVFVPINMPCMTSY